MDKLIIDEETLWRIASSFRGAASSLDECSPRLHQLRADAQQAFHSDVGTFDAEFERRMDNCVRKLDELCERTAGLASATGRVMDLFAETELSIRRGMEGLAVNAAAGPGGAPHGSQPGAAATARLNGPATIVPDWLERAANRYYGGGGGAW